MTEKIVVEVRDLEKAFGAHKALSGLTFTVAEGEIFGLVGPDGAGKSTCLRVLCGLLRPTAGSVQVLGLNVVTHPEAVKPLIGYMAQPAALYEDLTVEENVAFYADLYEVPPEQYHERRERLLTFSGLGPFTRRLFRNLSGGMKQKAGLTCALIHRPRLLFLDEPTNGVDPVSRRDFWRILYELNREGVTVVVASTYLDEVDRCHRVALLEGGRTRLVTDPRSMHLMVKQPFYALSASDLPRALRLLKTLPQVKGPAIVGAGVHFSLESEDLLPEVEKALVHAGLGPFQMEPLMPGLEEVYLSLVVPTGDKTP